MNHLVYNNAKRICREIIIRIAKGVMNNNLSQIIDRIPLEMRPNNNEAIRCCIYKDRAVIKYRCMATLGMPVEEETDELTSLADYAQQAMAGQFEDKPLLTVLDVACSTCKKTHYHITNACKGCIARPCTLVCHKKAITIQNGQAQMDMDKCVNCGKCMKACPYQSIIRVPIPCQEACPVKAVEDSDDGRKVINEEKCIHCGKCLSACPFGAIMECSQMINVLKAIKGKSHVTAIPAPALAGQFDAEWSQIENVLYELGFDAVIPVALGADQTIQHEAAELKQKIDNGQTLMTTSCCPAYIQAVEKHVPEMKPFVSDTPTPMQYTAELARLNNPETTVVFIGPCLAKKIEAKRSDVDFVLTFEELGAMIVAAELFPDESEELNAPSQMNENNATEDAKRFPISGAVANAVLNVMDDSAEIVPVCLENLDKKNMALLKQYAKGKCPGNFLEVMACADGCVGGPCTLQKSNLAKKQIESISKNQLQQS